MKTEFEISQVIEKIEVDGETFVPLVELLDMALEDIFGTAENLSPMIEVYREGDTGFGIVGHHFDDRVGFTLAFEKGWKEFQLSIDDARSMKIDQLRLFDQLREWGFKI